MNLSIFEYRNYKSYLKHVIETAPSQGRGLRQRFAEAAGCQLPYVSHVLNGNYHFSSEQIDGIGRYLKLRDHELEFLLLLVQMERAATMTLKSFYRKLIEKNSTKNSSIVEKLKPKESLDSNDRAVYYSSWVYAAIHMLTTIPDFQTKAKIAERLNISPQKVEDVLDFLTSRNLVVAKNGKLQARAVDVHLENDSIHIPQHHTNWRMQSIASLTEQREEDLHYSLAFTASREDLPKVRAIIAEALKNCADVIRPSKEEELAVLSADLFVLKGD